MIKLLFRRIGILFFFWVVSSCAYDELELSEPIDCKLVTFTATILPIISTSCAITGCHVPGTGRQNFMDNNTIKNNAEEIKERTQIRDMPRRGSLTQKQIDQIACWVDNGAPLN